jgi:uncharacterized protein
MKISRLHFQPLYAMASKHLQMIISSKLSAGKAPLSQSRLIDLNEGDMLSCEVSIPENWKETDQTVVLVHGLGGSHTSNYMIRLARKLYLKGNKVVRVNLRGCGSGSGLSKLPYHAGTSKDLLKVLEFFKAENSASEIVVIGFSLGGNVALKLAGELGVNAEKYVKTFIAVCPPIDLFESVKKIQEKANRLYHFYYLKKLCEQAKSWIPRKIQSIYDFDDNVTAPLWGYKNALEYYQECSSLRYLPQILQTTHLLFAEDDPFVCLKGLQGLSLPKNIHIWMTEKGSHMGFLGKTSKAHSPHWMDDLLLCWIDGNFSAHLLPN